MKRMSRRDYGLWSSTSSLQDLGDLTALYLEGKIASQPGYQPGTGPDEETQPHIATLAAVNRAGFVTTCSQPGDDGPGYDGKHWRQRAAVDGFISDVCDLKRLAQAAGLTFIAKRSSRWKNRYQDAVAVTERDGRHLTGFGVQLSRRHLRDPWVGYGVCSEAAQDALCDAWQVTIIDPEWGRNTVLWPMLDRYAKYTEDERQAVEFLNGWVRSS